MWRDWETARLNMIESHNEPQVGLWSHWILSIIVPSIGGIEAGFTTVIPIADQSSTDVYVRGLQERTGNHGPRGTKLKMDGRSKGSLQNLVRQYWPSVSTESGMEWYLGITLDKDWMAGRASRDAICNLGCLTVVILQDYRLDKATISLESVYLQSIEWTGRQAVA